MSVRVYYHYPLQFHYNSGQTIQVIQDYKSLSERGYEIVLFGTYEDEEALQEIRHDIGTAPIELLLRQGHTKWNRDWLKWRCLFQMMRDRGPKVMISRNYNKVREVVTLRWLLGQCWILMERHEDAFPYLLKKQHHAARDRERFRKLFTQIDAVIFTNYSQKEIFLREFHAIPPSIVLPNGVDLEQFSRATAAGVGPEGPFPITYIGQFTPWKNVELLFRALTYLDSRYVLRLAGGKGDEASREWVETLTKRYGLAGRVDYRGFVSRTCLVDDVLQGSAALLLPLGDNLESRYLTSPMKLFEYMATGIPVVAVDYPSVRLITGDESVYLAPNDALAFASAIQQAVTAPAASRAQRGQAMNTIAQQYTYGERARRFDQYLQQLMSPAALGGR